MGSDGGKGKGGDAGRAGRDRVRAAQAQQKAAGRRRRQFAIGAVVVVVLGIAAVVGVLVSNNTSSSNKATRNAFGAGLPFAAPRGVSASPATQTDPGGIVYGGNPNAPVTLQIWEDVRCPYCKQAEDMFSGIYQQYANEGKIKVETHLVDLIDRADGGSGSLFGGTALACAQDVGSPQYIAYHNLLYKNQPDESDDAYGSVDHLLSLASQVDGLRSPAFDACVQQGKYAQWVKANYDALGVKLGGPVGTPDIYIDGTPFQLQQTSVASAEQQQAAFKAALDAEIAKKG
jgi:protein-disulfide isomerase